MTRRVVYALVALLGAIALGTIGYMAIEDARFFDALYMTVITVSTVGYAEVIPLSGTGRVFTMLLVVTGFGAMLFSLGTFITFVVEGHLRELLEGRRMSSGIERLSDHHIVAGLGRVGSVVARQFAEEGSPFVVIEQSPDALEEAKAAGWYVVAGDATDEGVLVSAGVGRARSLVTALDTDADNLFVTFTARALNPDLFIVARSSHESSEERIKRAGANRVMTPNVIGGRRMAAMVLHPAVSDYLDMVTHGERVEYRLQEFDVTSRCAFADSSIKDAHIRDRTGAYILAIQGTDGAINTNPSSDTVIRAGDRLVVLGTTAQLDALACQM